MITLFLFLMIGSSGCSVAVDPRRRVKRIQFGDLLPSLATYKTYYFVQLRRSWACVTDQTNHEDLTSCQLDYNKCGGTLIHPEFVLTAAHCLMYFEVVVYEKFGKPGSDHWIKDESDEFWFSLVEAWEKFKHTIIGFFVVPKPRHTVYSDWALFVGSQDSFKMKQKRHVLKVFPHRVFPKNIRVGKQKKQYDITKNTWHDVALLQTCEAFNIKSGEVELAPMLNTVDKLRTQYERIAMLGLVCLYLGFGRQDNEAGDAKLAGHPQYMRHLMLHTWRSSKCYSACNSDVLRHPSDEHTCNLCSWHHGGKLGSIGKGDSGSPVTCEGKFVSTVTKGVLSGARFNHSRVDSYPLHCVKNSIGTDQLNYFKTTFHSQYHPLNKKLRRFPLH